MKKVFISAGHGGSDPGAVANGFKEKDLNLDIALACGDYLKAYGVNVKLSRTKDENDDISQEAAESNAFGPDYTVSIHNNAGGGDGIEAWYQIDGSSKALAENILAEAVKIGQNSRGAKKRANSNGTDFYGFIRQTNAPAVIVECAFVDNAKDMEIIDTLAERKAMGVAIAKGILKTLGITEKPAVEPTPAPTPTTTTTVDKNDVVSIAANAVYYNGTSIPDWVKNKNWIVAEVTGDRAVIDKSEDGKNDIDSPINVKYLTVVKTTSTPTTKPTTNTNVVEEGDVVSIAANATYYDGGEMPNWVKDKNWYVDEVNGDRAVIGKSEDELNSINSPVNVKYLTVVKDANKSSAPTVSTTNVPFKVKVSISNLNIRTGAGTNFAATGHFCPPGVYTIVEVKEGKGSEKGWGKLKSGAGWISLDFAARF